MALYCSPEYHRSTGPEGKGQDHGKQWDQYYVLTLQALNETKKRKGMLNV